MIQLGADGKKNFTTHVTIGAHAPLHAGRMQSSLLPLWGVD